VTGEDGASFIDQDWVSPKAPDALHQAGNLTFWVPPRIARKFLQLADRTPDHMIQQAARLAARGARLLRRSHDHTSPHTCFLRARMVSEDVFFYPKRSDSARIRSIRIKLSAY
jgi:hypothetical protein